MIMLDAGRAAALREKLSADMDGLADRPLPVADLTPNSPDEKLSFGDALCPMSTSRSRRRGSAHHGTESGTHSGRDRSAGPRAGKNPATTVVVIDEVPMENWGIGGAAVACRRQQRC